MQVKEYCTEELLKRLDKDKPDDWVRGWAGVCVSMLVDRITLMLRLRRAKHLR